LLKGVVHLKKNDFTHPHVIQDENIDENIPGFSSYNGLHWEPYGSRSK